MQENNDSEKEFEESLRRTLFQTSLDNMLSTSSAIFTKAKGAATAIGKYAISDVTRERWRNEEYRIEKFYSIMNWATLISCTAAAALYASQINDIFKKDKVKDIQVGISSYIPNR